MNRLPHLTEPLHSHLTEAQVVTLLDAPDSADASLRQHLSACPHCAAEVASLGATLTNFRAAATGLASAQPLRLTRTAPARGAQTPFRRYAWAASFATASVALAVTLSVVHPLHLHSDAPVPVPAVARPAPQVAAESDEALLDGIQQDLSTSVPPSLAPLEVSSSTGATN